MKKIAISLLLVTALVISAMAFTATAATTVAPNNVSAYAAETMAPMFENTGKNIKTWCPVCNKEVTWESYGVNLSANANLSNKHYYLNADVSNKGYYIAESGKSGCLYLNGHNITASSVAFDTNGGTINVIGHGTETVTAVGYGDSSTLARYGDVVNCSGGTANLFGGTYQKAGTKDAGAVIGGATAFTFNMYAGTTLTGGTNNGWLGGNICANVSGAKINIHGGLVTGGTAKTGANIYVSGSGTEANILGGTVENGVATGDGGNIYADGTATVTIAGGTVQNGSAAAEGGNIKVSGASLVITSGTVSGGTQSTDWQCGANVTVAAGGSLVMSGGSITGGNATHYGGALYLKSSSAGFGTATLTGGAITGGTAKTGGGTAYVEGSSILTLNGGTLGGGSAPNGGSLYLAAGGTAKIGGGTLNGGTATSNGGAVYLAAGSVTMTTGTISGGNAKNGGAVYVAGGSFTMSGGTMENGQATGDGGNLHVASGAGTVSLTGGTITGGKGTGSGSAGGNIFAASGKLPTVGAVTIQNGSAGYAGAGFYLYDNVTLNGTIIKNNTCNMSGSPNLTIDGACNMEDIVVISGKVHVKDTFTGTAWLYGVTFEGDSRGTYLDATKYTCDGPFLGTVKLYGKNNAVVSGTAEGKLIYGITRLFDKNGQYTWCGDVADAIKKWNANSAYIVPNSTVVPVIVPAGATAILNLNGDKITNVQVGEGAKVYVYDTNAGSNLGYISYGSIATDKVESFFVAPDGYVYVAVTTDGVTKMHRVEISLTGLSLRPSEAGMYYTAKVNTSAAAKQLLNFGVAVKTGGEIGADLTGTSYTQVPAANGTTNGVMVSNILTAEKATAERANTVIYAKAYVQMGDKIIMSEAKNFSLTQLMGKINEQFDGLQAAKKPGVANFYNTYASKVGWELDKIAAFVAN